MNAHGKYSLVLALLFVGFGPLFGAHHVADQERIDSIVIKPDIWRQLAKEGTLQTSSEKLLGLLNTVNEPAQTIHIAKADFIKLFIRNNPVPKGLSKKAETEARLKTQLQATKQWHEVKEYMNDPLKRITSAVKEQKLLELKKSLQKKAETLTQEQHFLEKQINNMAPSNEDPASLNNEERWETITISRALWLFWNLDENTAPTLLQDLTQEQKNHLNIIFEQHNTKRFIYTKKDFLKHYKRCHAEQPEEDLDQSALQAWHRLGQLVETTTKQLAIAEFSASRPSANFLPVNNKTQKLAPRNTPKEPEISSVELNEELWTYLYNDEKEYLNEHFFALLWGEPYQDISLFNKKMLRYFSNIPTLTISEEEFLNTCTNEGQEREPVKKLWRNGAYILNKADKELKRIKKGIQKNSQTMSEKVFALIKDNPEFIEISTPEHTQELDQSFLTPKKTILIEAQENPQPSLLKWLRLIKDAREELTCPKSTLLPGEVWHYWNDKKNLTILLKYVDQPTKEQLALTFSLDKGAAVPFTRTQFIENYCILHPDDNPIKQKNDAALAWTLFHRLISDTMEKRASAFFEPAESPQSPVDKLNARDEEGKTELIRATIKGNHQTVQSLLDSKADPELLDNDGQTARDYAQLSRNRIIRRLLVPQSKPQDELPAEKNNENRSSSHDSSDGDASDIKEPTPDKELEQWRVCRQALNSDQRRALTSDDLYLLKKQSSALSQQEKRLLDTLLDEQPVRRVKATPAAKFGIFTPTKNDHDQPKKKKNNKNKNKQKKKQAATASHQSAVATREPAPEKVVPLSSYSPLDRAAIDETNALVTASLMKKIQAHKLNSLPLAQNDDESTIAHQEPVDEEKEKPAQNNVPQKLFLDPETPLLFAKVVRDHYLTQEDYAKALQTGKVTQQQFNGCYRLGSKTMFPRLSLDYLVDQLREGFDNNIAHAAEQPMRDGTYRTIFETTITNPDIVDIRYNQIPVRYVLVKDNNYRKIISVYPLIPRRQKLQNGE